MNIFYASPEQIYGNIIELKGQEARHASKALRYSKGDDIVIVDGEGGWFEGVVQLVEKDSLRVEVSESEKIQESIPRLTLGLSIIKKRDRLEFAIEKAVELGVAEIVLFKSEHTIKQNVRMDRLEATAVSAMKQSLRAWLPSITLLPDLDHLLSQSDAKILVAHEKIEGKKPSFEQYKTEENLLLLVGPEGGFSEEEVLQVLETGGEKVSLGKHRLRAETAVVTLLSQFI